MSARLSTEKLVSVSLSPGEGNSSVRVSDIISCPSSFSCSSNVLLGESLIIGSSCVSCGSSVVSDCEERTSSSIGSVVGISDSADFFFGLFLLFLL
jgi:hypothetical protein